MHIHSIELEGLWSYRERQHVDIKGLPLVVATGENGVGKSTILVSSLLVAFYGKFPTKTIEESITTGCPQGHVSVEFSIGDTLYRVGRVYPVKGTASGVVAVADPSEKSGWRTVTEKGIREVNAYITTLLGMNYETASMTWIAEQGQYGKFSAALPAERFKLLSGIFGLDDYGPKAAAASAKMRRAESEMERLDGRIDQLQELMEFEIDVEATELGEVSDDALNDLVETANKEVDRIGLEIAELSSIDPRRKTVEARQALDLVRNARISRLETASATHARATGALATARERGERLRGDAERQYKAAVVSAEARTQATRERAATARAVALAALEAIAAAERSLPELAVMVEQHQTAAEAARAEAVVVAETIVADRARREVLKAEWASLKASVADAEARIETLHRSSVDESHAACFTCGQHLSTEDAAALIASQHGDIDRAQARQVDVKSDGVAAAAAISSASASQSAMFERAQSEDLARQDAAGQLSRAEQVVASKQERENAADDADIAVTRAEDEEAAIIGTATKNRDSAIEASTTDEDEVATSAGIDLVASSAAITKCETPTAEEVQLAGTLASAEELVADAVAVVETQRAELEGKRTVSRETTRALAREIARRAEVTANRTERQARLDAAIDERATVEVDQKIYATLQKAYSPGGIPAMILGGVVDELNEAVNSSLERLSRGALSVELRTARETASGTTENKVTVFVATSTGVRSYESLSGGQKFRVDLAIRTGLNKAVARGTGTPVQTFVLDEGWGSLDEKGILSTFDTLARLSEDTNVLTVSHLDSVKEAFPSRIEVSMTGGNSVAEVVR